MARVRGWVIQEMIPLKVLIKIELQLCVFVNSNILHCIKTTHHISLLPLFDFKYTIFPKYLTLVYRH